jgi:hypothetical protein
MCVGGGWGVSVRWRVRERAQKPDLLAALSPVCPTLEAVVPPTPPPVVNSSVAAWTLAARRSVANLRAVSATKAGVALQCAGPTAT